MRVASPCVRNCCLDDDDICLGCHRTLNEITEWGEASDARRRAIRDQAEQRGKQRRQIIRVRDY